MGFAMKVLNEEKLSQMAEYIKTYMHEHNGEPPKFADILEYMGMTKSVGYRYLTRLKERGIIEYNGKGTLGMNGIYTQRSHARRVPILGQVICGSPEEEEEYAEGYLAIPEEWIQGECFLLRAYGDSMIDIGIERNDLILVQKNENPVEGQVIVARIDTETTLKRLGYENGRPILIAENSSYSEEERIIRPKKFEAIGVAIKLIKNIS